MEQAQAAINRVPLGDFLFSDGAQVEAAWDPSEESITWVQVAIKLRTHILTAEGHWHAAYVVQDARLTEWIVGEGELRQPPRKVVR